MIDAHGYPIKGRLLPPVPAEMHFRSGVGTQASDGGSSWLGRSGPTKYSYPRGATNIEDYVLTEFSIKDLDLLPYTPRSDLIGIVQALNIDLIRPQGAMRLSDLLNEVHTRGFHYDRIVGNFCRGTIPPHGHWKAVRRKFGFYY